MVKKRISQKMLKEFINQVAYSKSDNSMTAWYSTLDDSFFCFDGQKMVPGEIFHFLLVNGITEHLGSTTGEYGDPVRMGFNPIHQFWAVFGNGPLVYKNGCNIQTKRVLKEFPVKDGLSMDAAIKAFHWGGDEDDK